MKKPLSRTIKTFYGISDFGFSFMTGGMENTWLMFFMTNVAEFSLASISIATTIAAFVDAFMQPVYGGIITGTRAGRWGRNRTYLVFWPILVAVTFVTLFTNIGSKTTGVIIVAASLCLTNGFRSLPWIAHLNMITVLANDSDERARLASLRGTWSSVGGIVSSYVATPLIGFLGVYLGSVTLGYTVSAGVMGLIYIIPTWWTFAFTKGYEPTGEEVVQTAAAKVTVMDMLRAAGGNPPLIVLLIADFFKYMSGFIMSASAAYYFNYIIGSIALMPTYLLLGSCFTAAGTSLSGIAAKKLSSKGAAVTGILGMGITLTINFFVARNLMTFFVLVLITRFFGGMSGASIIALYTDCVVYSKWKTGKNTAPFIMGSMTFALKTSYIVRGPLVLAVLAFVGFSSSIAPSDASETLKQGILAAFLLIPGLSYILSGLFLFFGYKLTREKVQQLQVEIDAREAQAVQQ